MVSLGRGAQWKLLLENETSNLQSKLKYVDGEESYQYSRIQHYSLPTMYEY